MGSEVAAQSDSLLAHLYDQNAAAARGRAMTAGVMTGAAVGGQLGGGVGVRAATTLGPLAIAAEVYHMLAACSALPPCAVPAGLLAVLAGGAGYAAYKHPEQLGSIGQFVGHVMGAVPGSIIGAIAGLIAPEDNVKFARMAVDQLTPPESPEAPKQKAARPAPRKPGL